MNRRIWIPAVLGVVLVAAGAALYPRGKGGRSGEARLPAAEGENPALTQLTTSTDEQDHPAIAQSGGTVYVSYVEFVHSDRQAEMVRSFTAPPASFDFLARPVGGDQVFLLTYSKSGRTWSKPVAVSAPKQDIMRAAVAVDGQKRVWVFWSANKNGNFDIYAKFEAGGNWSPEMRLTSDPGTDLNPVAATDASGRVWLAWQGYRNSNLEVLAAAQDGDRFTKETVVSFSPQSDWDPVIAAAPNGEVAVAWDTYDKGDYDVYFRRLKMSGGIRMEAPVAVAASPNFEARASIAYDSENRLWVAYEASAAKWGKDFGAYESTGVSLYQDHHIQVKCFKGNQAYATASALIDTLLASIEGGAAAKKQAKKQAKAPLTLPDPDSAKNRRPNGNSAMVNWPLFSFPRLAADPNGTIYVSFRVPIAGQTAIGLGWDQTLVYYDGSSWKGPIAIPNSDGTLDVRPALAAIGPGDLLMVVPSDHRMLPPIGGGDQKLSKKQTKQAAKRAAPGVTGVNVDLFAEEFRVGAPAGTASLREIPAATATPPDAGTEAERAQIALMRQYRATLGSDKLQLMRGEFHRHTELSGHGRDGPVIDAYRYLIDTASMDWGGCCDHDDGMGREYYWWAVQKLSDAYRLGTTYVPMFVYERSVQYPEGHRNVVFPRRGIRPLPRMPITKPDSAPTPAPDTQMLYSYLKHFGGIVASHTSGTGMGTDWRDNDPVLEPVVEIYQGDRQNYEMPGAPRTNSADDSIGGWRPLGFVSLALKKGYRLGFQASSDHTSTHMSYCNLWVTSPTREALMEAFRKRRIYGATDNILADVRCGSHFMGEEFTTSEPPAIAVKLWGADKFAKVHIIRNGEYAYSVAPDSKTVDFVWRDEAALQGQTSYYYVRGEQADGELVWVSPMWITYRPGR